MVQIKIDRGLKISLDNLVVSTINRSNQMKELRVADVGGFTRRYNQSVGFLYYE